MSRFYLLVILFFTRSDLDGIIPDFFVSLPVITSQQDTLKENQILYNGKIWRNHYHMVMEDQFLFSKEFLPGSLTIRGKTYTNLNIKYDIYKDEILTPYNLVGILQLNKELIDSFSIFFQNKTYRFARIPDDSLNGLEGYVNVIYKGKTALYVKLSKKIEKLAVEGVYDEFYQVNQIFFVKGNIAYLITGKSDFLKVFTEDKELIKNFIKKNKLKISKKSLDSFLPLIDFYESISH